MTTVELGEPVKLGKHFRADTSQPLDSKLHHWSETFYDGRPGSYAPNVPNHWHKYHDEFMQVVEGSVKFVMDGKESVLGPDDGIFHIPKMHVHGFQFAEGTKTTMREFTDPAGDYKEAFFRDMLQLATDKGPSILMALRAFNEGDTFVALPGGFKPLDEVATRMLGFIASFFVPNKQPLARQHADME